MKFSLLLISLLGALLCSCSPKIDSRLVGTWESHSSATKGEVYQESTYYSSGKFKDGGHVTFKNGIKKGFSSSGTWRVDNDLLIEKVEESSFETPGGEYKTKLRFVDADTIELTFSEGPGHLIHRVKK